MGIGNVNYLLSECLHILNFASSFLVYFSTPNNRSMKKIVWSIAAATLFFASCENAPEADRAEASEAQQVSDATGTSFVISHDDSKVEWIGTKPTGKHHGTIKVKEGTIAVENGAITGGRFVMDITTIQPDDQDAEYNEKLRQHLLSGDFFEAEKYPDAVFEITGVQPVAAASEELIMKEATHTITGNLTLKDVTKSISFPAKISIDDHNLTADANFNIDRTQWGMNYKSDKSLGDKIIHSDVNLTVRLVATK